MHLKSKSVKFHKTKNGGIFRSVIIKYLESVEKLMRTMPSLSHWPDRSVDYSDQNSHVLQWIANKLSLNINDSKLVMNHAARKKLIIFDKTKKTWQGAI